MFIRPRKFVVFLIATLAITLCVGWLHAFAVDIPITPDKPIGQYYFRFVTHGGDDPYWAVLHQGMIDACKELGVKADMDFCGENLALQQKRFKEAVAMKCDGIALVLNEDTVWDKLVEDAMAKGIPVISIDCDDTKGAKGNQRLCFIGQDERAAGRQIAERLFSVGREKGVNFKKAHVAMSIEVPGQMYEIVRTGGILDVMKE